MKNEFLIQKAMRYHYDRCVSAAGAKLIEVGDEAGTSAAQLRAAIGPNTAGILYFARADKQPGVLSIPQVVEIAHAAGIRVILDAAGEVYPLERMTWLPQSGADLICFGAKYMGSAHSTGILCGQRALVEAAKLNGFISYEAKRNYSMGRGYKVDRQEIIGAYAAVQEWMQLDHEERLQSQATRIDAILAGLRGIPDITAENVYAKENGPWMRLRVAWDAAKLGKTAADVAAALRAGEPSVWVRVEGDDIYVCVHTLREGEEQLVAQGLRAQLAR